MGYCENCGCKAFRGLCTNCHEENYIEQQYIEDNKQIPKNIYEKARQNEQDVYLEPIQDNLKKEGKNE